MQLRESRLSEDLPCGSCILGRFGTKFDFCDIPPTMYPIRNFGVRKGIACRALVGCGGGVEVETAVPSSKSYHRAEEAQTFIFPP